MLVYIKKNIPDTEIVLTKGTALIFRIVKNYIKFNIQHVNDTCKYFNLSTTNLN